MSLCPREHVPIVPKNIFFEKSKLFAKSSSEWNSFTQIIWKSCTSLTEDSFEDVPLMGTNGKQVLPVSSLLFCFTYQENFKHSKEKVGTSCFDVALPLFIGIPRKSQALLRKVDTCITALLVKKASSTLMEKFILLDASIELLKWFHNFHKCLMGIVSMYPTLIKSILLSKDWVSEISPLWFKKVVLDLQETVLKMSPEKRDLWKSWHLH